MQLKAGLKTLVVGGFEGLVETWLKPHLDALVGAGAAWRKRSDQQVIVDLIYHQLHDSGTLADHGAQLESKPMSNSAYAQRRSRIKSGTFERIMEAALGPLADTTKHPEAFFLGLRLVGLDGTMVSVLNAPGLKGAYTRQASRRAGAAFAKIRIVTAMELMLHAPLAAASGDSRECEFSLAMKVVGKIPPKSLVIVDRGFSPPKYLAELMALAAGNGTEFLARARYNIKSKVVHILEDGSALVEVSDWKKSNPPFVIREVRSRLTMSDGRTSVLRLWTTLLDPQKAPAAKLVDLYAQRWEHELAYRQLKLDLKSAQVLGAQTAHTALQEIAALILAMAAVARVRLVAAQELDVPVLRVSFAKLLDATLWAWNCLDLFGDSIPQNALDTLSIKLRERLRRSVLLPKRTKRNCPRGVRCTVTAWPRVIGDRIPGPVFASAEVIPFN
jgi:hypothetical protein